MGLFGNLFLIDKFNGKIVVIGGGVGIFFFVGFCKEFKNRGNKVDVFFGFRDLNLMFLVERFKDICDNILIVIDDGSSGYKGSVVDFFKVNFLKVEYKIVFCCGLKFMLKVIKNFNFFVKCYVFLEEKMVCGIGVCFCCSIKGKGDKMYYVCLDGFVFDIMEVEIE